MIQTISLDMLQSTGIGALALLLGMLMTRNIKWLQKFCIPSPVSGGLVFSIATLILYKVFHIELTFDGTLKDVFMLAFFTSVGFQSNLKVLRQGGKTLVLMLCLLVGIIVLQNALPLTPRRGSLHTALRKAKRHVGVNGNKIYSPCRGKSVIV